METINPDKFTPRCYAFIQNELGEVLVLRERWSGMDLNKLPGGGQELGGRRVGGLIQGRGAGAAFGA